MIDHPNGSDTGVASVRGLHRAFDDEFRAVLSFNDSGDFVATPVNHQSVRQALPVFLDKPKFHEELGLAPTALTIQRQQIPRDFGRFDVSVFRVGQPHAYPRGRPNPRLAMMLRCTSLVPAAMVWEKARSQCSCMSASMGVHLESRRPPYMPMTSRHDAVVR